MGVAVGVEASAWDRLSATVCRRAFSSPEAFLYELGIGPAVAGIVSPLVVAQLNGERVLDVGCGGGHVAVNVALATGSQIVAIDPSASQARRVARRSRSMSIKACRAAAQGLPFRDHAFDAIFSSCALKHWPSPGDGVRECARVARSGGVVIVVEIDGASTPAEVRAFTRLTRVPPGLREAYVRFAMRTVVGVAPDAAALAAVLEPISAASPLIRKIEGFPFLLGSTTTA